MRLPRFLKIISILIGLVHASCICMESPKKSLEKVGFRELDENAETNELDNNNDSSENSDNEVYTKRHASGEIQEKKDHEYHKIKQKNRHNRLIKKQQKLKGKNFCTCHLANKKSIQCNSCKQWHTIPAKCLLDVKKEQWECINNTWDPHLSNECYEKKRIVIEKVSPEESVEIQEVSDLEWK